MARRACSSFSHACPKVFDAWSKCLHCTFPIRDIASSTDMQTKFFPRTYFLYQVLTKRAEVTSPNVKFPEARFWPLTSFLSLLLLLHLSCAMVQDATPLLLWAIHSVTHMVQTQREWDVNHLSSLQAGIPSMSLGLLQLLGHVASCSRIGCSQRSVKAL